jgi:hypothetical protein
VFGSLSSHILGPNRDAFQRQRVFVRARDVYTIKCPRAIGFNPIAIYLYRNRLDMSYRVVVPEEDVRIEVRSVGFGIRLRAPE